MSNKKYKIKTSRRRQDAILKKQIYQLHIDLKRGLFPYCILFFLKVRPHYSLEIHRKMSYMAGEVFIIQQNIVYQNLKKFEQKGIVASYMEKSNIGAKRKYYYLTKFGEHIFEEIVTKELYPLMFMFSNIMEKKIGKFGIKHKISTKEKNRFRNLIDEAIKK